MVITSFGLLRSIDIALGLKNLKCRATYGGMVIRIWWWRRKATKYLKWMAIVLTHFLRLASYQTTKLSFKQLLFHWQCLCNGNNSTLTRISSFGLTLLAPTSTTLPLRYFPLSYLATSWTVLKWNSEAVTLKCLNV